MDSVEEAMRDAAVSPRDSRGLMPLSEARAIVRGATEFRKGQGQLVGGKWVLPSDRLWAALLSLEDVAEFVREAKRISWHFHPRGQEGCAPFHRYGPGILGWLRSFILPNGVLVNVPWCVAPCWWCFDSEEVFDLLWSVREVYPPPAGPGPGPFAVDTVGDVEVDWVELAQRRPAEPDNEASGLVIDWIYAQPAIGFAKLAALSEQGERRARRMLKSLAEVDPREAFAHAAAALGDARARAAFAAANAPAEIDEAAILAMLDRAAAGGRWPTLTGSPRCHGLRLVGARARDGDGWGVVFERIEGDSMEELAVRPFAIGSEILARVGEPPETGPISIEDQPDPGCAGTTVVGPRGPLCVDDAFLRDHDVDPASLGTTGYAGAYLAQYPDCLWHDPQDLVELLAFPGDDAEILVVTAAFAHTDGPEASVDAPPPWRVLPSESPTYRSLAKALASRDPDAFVAGPSNVDPILRARSDRDA